MALWFGVSVPLTFLGAFLGFRRNVIEYPVRTADIPRQIPEQPWYLHQIILVLVGGLLPFGAIFVELFFILTSIWLDQYYYVFGFLLVVCLVLILTCAEITVVMDTFSFAARIIDGGGTPSWYLELREFMFSSIRCTIFTPN